MRWLIVASVILLNLLFLKTAPFTLAVVTPFLVVFLMATAKKAPGNE